MLAASRPVMSDIALYSRIQDSGRVPPGVLNPESRHTANPFELAAVKLLIFKKPVMVSFYKIFLPIQLTQDLIRRAASGNGKITQDIYLIFLRNMIVPLPDHMCIHLFITGKAAHIHAVIQVVMIKMQVCNIQFSHRYFPAMLKLLLQLTCIQMITP